MNKKTITTHFDLPPSRAISLSEACIKYGLKKSYMYKLTSRRQIPHYKPLGKLIFFDEDELHRFILSNRIMTFDEIRQEAQRRKDR